MYGYGIGYSKVNVKRTLNLSGLELWLDSLDSNTMTLGGGNEVSQWNDKNGSSNYVTQTTGINQPIWNGTNSLLFDGIDDYMSSNTGIFNNISNKLTIDLWIKLNATTTETIFHQRDSLNNVDLALFVINGSPVKFIFITGGSDLGVSYTNNININQWYNIIITLDSNNGNMYVNGTFSSNDSNMNGFDNSLTSTFYVGRATPPNNIFFNGNIGSIKLYNRILTQQEITQSYNFQKSKYGL